LLVVIQRLVQDRGMLANGSATSDHDKMNAMTTEQGKKPGRGCLFYGGIVGAIILAVLILAAYLGYRYARHLVDQFTDTSPAPMPTMRISSEELKQVQERIDRFSKVVSEGKADEPLVITGDEVNALIMSDTGAEKIRGHLYVTLEGNQVKAQISIPAEMVGLRPLRGRFINGTGEFKVSLHDGKFEFIAESLSAKGQPLPENVMRHIRAQNLASQFNEDPDFASAISKLQDIQVRDGKLIIVPKKLAETKPE
jgi:hypothetical protein